MSNKCLLRVEELLKRSTIKAAKKDEIINAIKTAQAEKKLSTIDEINVDKIAKEVTEQIKAQKKINKRNAIENEIKVRKLTEYVLTEFSENPEEGLIAILVGSNDQKLGSRASVSVQQVSSVNQLIAGFNARLKENNLVELFDSADKNTQLAIARTMFELNQRKTAVEENLDIKPPVTEKNPQIVKLAEIMEDYSEMIRQKLNDRGANIANLWGYIVRQSHDPFRVRDAANILKIKDVEVDPNLKNKKDINYNKNYTAWKNFIMNKLDQERTFADVDDIDNFLINVYNTLVGNKYQMSDGASSIFGSRDVAKSSVYRRVLHFKTADDWFAYNDIFGAGNLKEAFFSGMQTAGRNIGIMDTLGTKPKDNFEKIRAAVHQRLVDEQKGGEATKSFRPFEKYLNAVDGSIYSVEKLPLAKYSAIVRAIATMAKLGGATLSAAADIGLYASELKYQGRSFLGGMFEAMNNIRKIKNSKDRKDISEGLGFVADNTVYDISARYQVGDALSKGWTRLQRTFFKLNLLSWWTNTLKEGAMLGMANYFAKQKNIEFNNLKPALKTLFEQYNIDSKKWNIIRKKAMVKADDGTEFLNIVDLDKLTDQEVKQITGIDNLTKRQISIEKDKFKASVSGILLDRSIYAVIEPDSRGKAFLTGGRMAGTPMGEVLRFITQFKAFPFAIYQKTLQREMSFLKKGGQGDVRRGILGLTSVIVTSGFFGYLAMTIKDLLKGRTPRDPTKGKTILAAFLQGGGLGIYGDVLFQEARTAGERLGSLLGPTALTAGDLIQALYFGITGKGGSAARSTYNAVQKNIPFLNLFYIKSAFDYLIGYQIMETLSPGILRRMERKMEKDYGQDFLFTKPSFKFKGF
jgi:hypothetical protein